MATEPIKIKYNPDHIVQDYYKKINDALLLITSLNLTVTDEEVKRNAYSTFEKNIDLTEVRQE